MFRSYNAFASKSYRMFMWILYPAVAVFCCFLVQNGCFGFIRRPGFHFMVAESLLCYCIVFVESLGDYWLFSGIQSKYANHMEFLKGSTRGKQIFRNAIIFDVIRRALTVVICTTVNVLLGIFVYEFDFMGAEGIYQIVIYALCCYFFSMLAVFITRYGDMWWLNFGTGYAGSMVVIAMTMLSSSLSLPQWSWLVIYLIAGIGITVVAVRTAMKKVEESYYDQRA